MTVIVAIRTPATSPRKVWMGCDAMVSGYQVYHEMAAPKIFKVGRKALIGVSGTVRTSQLIQHNLKLPPRCNKDPMTYMVNDFVTALRNAVREGGTLHKDNEVESLVGHSYMLIGYEGRIFEVSSFFSVTEIADHHAAIGSGFEVALGSLQTTIGDRGIQRRIETALAATAHYKPYIRGPFTTLKMEWKGAP